ncbi:hypothetical protein ACF0H5_019310 [Mactra antiquata]
MSTNREKLRQCEQTINGNASVFLVSGQCEQTTCISGNEIVFFVSDQCEQAIHDMDTALCQCEQAICNNTLLICWQYLKYHI